MTLPPPRGFFAALLGFLERPATLVSALLCVALAAVLGVQGTGSHPFAGPWPQLALALAGFALLTRALARGRAGWPAACWTAGLAMAAVGAPLAGTAGGSLTVVAGGTEAYRQRAGERTLSTHLGGILRADTSVADVVGLRLAVKDRELGGATLPVDGSAAAALGPWRMRVTGRGALGDATHIRVALYSRASPDNPPTRLRLAEGEAMALPGDIRLEVRQISDDFGRALGPAAWLILQWPEGQDTSWHFVEAPDMDARLGKAPVRVVLEAVEAEAPLQMEVARVGTPFVLAAGLALMLVGLLLSLGRGVRA